MSHDPQGSRCVLVLPNVDREPARRVAREVVDGLAGHGVAVRLQSADAAALYDQPPAGVTIADPSEPVSRACELALVVGGDGSILRAAELVRPEHTPILGVNLGHVGFLAEAELEDLEATIEAIAARRYRIEERLTLAVEVFDAEGLVRTTFAVNEASVEKASRERMLEVVVEIDGRPLSRYGCDGVIAATPTGSTAYNFSAGGPIVWPEVEALCVVPISAHALFARPTVVAPTSVVAIEVLASGSASGVLWCDGRRSSDLPPGARIEIRRHRDPLRVARLRDEPFTDRLVAKLDLPVQGWRGSAASRLRTGRPLSEEESDR